MTHIVTKSIESHPKSTPASQALPVSNTSTDVAAGAVLSTGRRTRNTRHTESAVLAATPSGEVCSVYEYTDSRRFLHEAYEAKHRLHPSFSESAFVRKAGLSTNSRGYLRMVIEGKRNLTPATIRGFSDALGLDSRASLFFENLVNYTQARRPKDREYYFQRMVIASEGNSSAQVELLRSQYHYYSNWYLVAVRELVGLSSFDEDAAWISAHLRGKITPTEAQESLLHLERMGLIRREPTGKLVQTDPFVKYEGTVFNDSIRKFHSQMLDRAKESLEEDDFSERRASCVTLSCSHEQLPAMIRMVDEFRDAVTLKFGGESQKPDTVFQMGFQIFQLTPIQKSQTLTQSSKGKKK
jgi:uncharacterized protein (TIGR02147 family)